MVYILPELDLNFITFDNDGFSNFTIYTTTESRIKNIITNERCRSIFSKKEIVGLFGGIKMQMVNVKIIKIKLWDKIITWTNDGRWFVLEFIDLDQVNRINSQVEKINFNEIKFTHLKKEETWCGIKPSIKHGTKNI
jgi:hypothetical protein